MKIFGYGKSKNAKLMELSEVTFQVKISEIENIISFFQYVKKIMKKYGKKFGHEHFKDYIKIYSKDSKEHVKILSRMPKDYIKTLSKESDIIIFNDGEPEVSRN